MTTSKPPKAPSPEASRIGNLVREHRAAMPAREDGKTWSQARFAALVGVESTTVYMWESGRTIPSHQQLRALVEKAGMDPRTLIGEPGRVEGKDAGVAA